MFAAIAILICAIEVFASYFTQAGYYYDLMQLEILLVAIAALFSERTQRDNSVFAIFIIWFAWIITTDRMVDQLPLAITTFEAPVLAIAVFWALARPYFYPSADLAQRGENVYIGFYHGPHAPFLSSLAALIGLSFSSMVIVAGDKVLRASGVGKMMLSPAAILNEDDYVFIDTKKVADENTFVIMSRCKDKPTKAFGIFRTKCIRNCEPVLELLDLKPKSWPYLVPSVFYYQVVKGSR